MYKIFFTVQTENSDPQDLSVEFDTEEELNIATELLLTSDFAMVTDFVPCEFVEYDVDEGGED